MYDELAKRLKNCATQAAPCLTCDMTDDGSCIETLMKQAADAIEELTGFVQEAERDRDEYRERLDKANDAIEELNRDLDSMNEANIALYGTLPKWISVTERLPELNENVLVYSAHSGLICIDANIWFDRNATHWMPLPEPPKEDET